MIILFSQSHFQESLVAFTDDDQDIAFIHQFDRILDGEGTHRRINGLMFREIFVAAFQNIADRAFRRFVFRQNDDIQRIFTDLHHFFQTPVAVGIVDGDHADRFLPVSGHFRVIADQFDRSEIIGAIDDDIVFFVDPFHHAIHIRHILECFDQLLHRISFLVQCYDSGCQIVQRRNALEMAAYMIEFILIFEFVIDAVLVHGHVADLIGRQIGIAVSHIAADAVIDLLEGNIVDIQDETATIFQCIEIASQLNEILVVEIIGRMVAVGTGIDEIIRQDRIEFLKIQGTDIGFESDGFDPCPSDLVQDLQIVQNIQGRE